MDLDTLGRLRSEPFPLDNIRVQEQPEEQPPPDQIDRIADLLDHVGWKAPLLIDSEDTLLAGYERYLAAKQLDHEDVPVIRLPETDATEIGLQGETL